MDFQQLKVFREVARAGGFTRASESLHLSQSTVSLHIKRLEEQLGCPLFLRTKKRVHLSEAGQVLLEYVDRIFLEMKNAEMAVQELNRMERGTIRLGSGATTVSYLLPKVLGSYQRRFPRIELIVVTGSSEFLAQSVHQQTLDLAIVMQPVSPNLALEILPFLSEELVFVLSNSHPLAAKEWLMPTDLVDVPFISFLRGSAMQSQVDYHFAQIDFRPRVVMEMENIESVKALVRAGLGVAVLPLCSVIGSSAGTLRPMRIRRHRMERSLALALPKSRMLPRSILLLGNRITRGLAGKTISDIRAEVAGI